MAASWPTPPSGAYRDTNITAANQPFSFSCRFWLDHTPTGTPDVSGTVFYRGDDPVALYAEYVWIGTGLDGALYIDLPSTAAVVIGLCAPQQWHSLTYTYDPVTHDHVVTLDSLTTVTHNQNINAFNFTWEGYLTDTYVEDTVGGKLAYARGWDALLTPAQMSREPVSPTVVETTDLLFDVPLESDLLDISGNNNDFLDWDDTATFEDQPPINRYYPLAIAPRARYDTPVQGDWNAPNSFSGSPSSPVQWTWHALPDKTGPGNALGPIATFQWNATADYDWHFMRWLCGPFEAAAVDSLFDLCFYIRAMFEDGGLTPASDVRYRLHIYITVGETAEVREVLLDNYTDGASLNPTLLTMWQMLQSSQQLTGTMETGDCIMVEFGFHIESSPPTTPATYPPSVYTDVRCRNSGASTDLDATAGDTTAARTPWFQFSQTFIPLAASDPPDNDACADAIPITLDVNTPYTGDFIDTTAATGTDREIFFSWTAPADGRVFFTALGSNYKIVINAFTNGCTQTIQPSDFVQDTRLGTHRSQTIYTFTAEAGQAYLIRMRNNTSTTNGPNGGGLARLSAFYQADPVENDLYLPSGAIGVFREGQMINASIVAANFGATGVAFDYTKRPLTPINFPPRPVNTEYRLLLGLFDFTLVEIFDPYVFGSGDEELDFIGDPLAGIEHPAQIYVTAAGMLTVAPFGNGFLFVSGQGTLPAYMNDVSDNPAASSWYTISAVDGDNQPGAPFTAVVQTPSVQTTAPWTITLDEVNNVGYYASGAFYIPVDGQEVRAYNLGSSTDLGVHSTPNEAPVPVPSVRGMQYIGNGQLLVTNGDAVLRLGSDGSLLQTYTPSLPLYSQSLVDVKVTADGLDFWTVDLNTAQLFKFNIDSGAELLTAPTWLVPGSLVQMAIFQPNGFIPPEPPECPGNGRVQGPLQDGLPYVPVPLS